MVNGWFSSLCGGVLPALVSSRTLQIQYFQRSRGPRHYKYNASSARELPDTTNKVVWVTRSEICISFYKNNSLSATQYDYIVLFRFVPPFCIPLEKYSTFGLASARGHYKTSARRLPNTDFGSFSFFTPRIWFRSTKQVLLARWKMQRIAWHYTRNGFSARRLPNTTNTLVWAMAVFARRNSYFERHCFLKHYEYNGVNALKHFTR